MTLPIFIAGASAEVERPARWIAHCSQEPRLRVVHDWTVPVRYYRAHPKQHTAEVDAQQAQDDANALMESALLWALVPPPDVPTTNLWWEIGAAYAMGLEVVISGPWHRLIYGHLPWVRCFDSDGDAYAYVMAYARQREAA